ncbi:MAG: hypothetical protein WAL08_18340 [Candidatus Sulfotelmatobacter sp.]
MRQRASRYYQSVVDLRDFGYDAILHSFAKLSKNGDHKIELVQTGNMGFSHMVNELSGIFDVDAQKLVVMRVDLTADVPNIPVAWFLTHCRAQYKRWSADIGRIVESLEYSQMGMKEVQTFYLGKRPNVYRIYNKIAEYEYQYKQLLRRANHDAEIPPFDEIYGCSSNSILTRVERQLASGRVPPQIDTIKKLRSARSFNPFERLKFFAGCERDPQPFHYRSDVYERGMTVHQEILEQGLQRTRYRLNEQSRGNADRILKTLADFIPADGHRITSEELFARYQESVERQLRA